MDTSFKYGIKSHDRVLDASGLFRRPEECAYPMRFESATAALAYILINRLDESDGAVWVML